MSTTKVCSVSKSQLKDVSGGRGYVYGCRVKVPISKWLFTRQPFQSQFSYIHDCRVHTWNGYSHGSRSRANSAIYTTALCTHEMVIHMAAVREPIQLYTRLPCINIKWLFTRQPFQSQFSYIHDCRVHTWNGYSHGSRSRANSAIYTTALCTHEMVIHMAAVRESILLYTRLPCINIKWLFTRQPFQGKFSYIHGCRVYAYNCYLHSSHARP